MFPQYLLATNPNADQQFFYSAANNIYTQTWHKPIGRALAYILIIAGGGSGGGGGSSSTQGGGGGGCSATGHMIIPLWCLPDKLYIAVGHGGAPVSGNTNGNAGGNSIIGTITPSVVASDYVLANQGGAGQAAGTGGGTGSTVFRSLSNSGLSVQANGQVGGAGGANASGTTLTALTLSFMTAGAGGGGGANAGGNITGAGLLPKVNGGAGSGVGNGNPGESGITLRGSSNGFQCTGGSGGGATTVSLDVGGNGGNGGIGCGGGGGGSSTLSTGGSSGAGGPGFVGIWCF